MADGIQYFSTTPASNATVGNINMATGSAPSTVHPSIRQLMADIAIWYAAPEWVAQADAPTYSSGTVLTVPGNRTSVYSVGRRIQTVNTGGTITGTITVSAYTSLTTITVSWDSGSMDSGLSAVAVGILNSQLAHMSITGGTIDGTVIGGTTPAAGTFTTLGANGLNVTGSTIPANGIYLPSANTLGFATNSASRGSVNSTGNWSIAAPTSGTALTVSNVSGTGQALLLGNGSTDSGQSLVGIGSGYTNSRGTFASGYNNSMVVGSGVTGRADYFQAVVNTQAAAFSTVVHGFQAQVQTIGAGSTVSDLSGFFADSSVAGGTITAGFRGAVTSGTGKWNLYMDGTASNYMAGNLLLGTTTDAGAGYPLQVASNVASTTNASFTNANATGTFSLNLSAYAGAHTSTLLQWSDGLYISTTTADSIHFRINSAEKVRFDSLGNAVLNATGSALATSATAGFTYLPNTAGLPTGVPASSYTGATPVQWDSTHGVLMAYGTMSSGSAWWNAAGVMQQNVQSGNYTLALSDIGGTIYCTNTGAQTITIPANSSVAFPIGATVTIINAGTTNASLAITTDTLTWSGNGGTGTRTLSATQVATATVTKVTATRWTMSGSGVT